VLTQCSKEKARIFDSLLGNLGAVVDSLKAFNLTKDPRMDEVADELRALCVRYQTDDLRKSPEVRKAAATDAERTLRKAEEVLANLPW
jgi:HEPN domain-containing protein